MGNQKSCKTENRKCHTSTDILQKHETLMDTLPPTENYRKYSIINF